MESPTFESDPDEPSDPRRRYRVLRFGFQLGALALGLQSADAILSIASQFFGVRELDLELHAPQLRQILSAGLTCSAAISACLLVARFPDRSWNRRAGLLAVFNSFDILLWASRGKTFLWFAMPEPKLAWCSYFAGGLQWFEMLLYASLAIEFSAHLGREGIQETGRYAKGFALFGLTLWGLVLMGASHLGHGLPFFQIRSIDVFFMYLAGHIVLAIATFSAMLLCASASRESSRYIAEWDRAEANKPRGF